MNKNIRQKLIIAAALMIAATASAFAQGNGLAGINEATSMVSSYFDPGTKLIYAIGAVVGLIGGVKVYGKFSSGDPDIHSFPTRRSSDQSEERRVGKECKIGRASCRERV